MFCSFMLALGLEAVGGLSSVQYVCTFTTCMRSCVLSAASIVLEAFSISIIWILMETNHFEAAIYQMYWGNLSFHLANMLQLDTKLQAG